MKMNQSIAVHRIFSFLFVLFLSLAVMSCGKKEEGGNAQMISGSTSKIWKADKETNAAGDKEKLSSAEKEEQIQFFANGNFTQTSSTQSANGTWAYDAATKTLSLTYANNNVSQNFNVTKIDEDELTLQAPDGSTLALEAE
ncbi:MAG: lipocalin-like domain-containing protein [Rufibacter sp.]